MLIPVPGARRRCLSLLLCLVLGFSGVSLRAQSALDGFDPEVTGSVNALAVYSLNSGAYAGKIMVGGSFSQLQPHSLVTYYPASGLARLNVDGSVDTSFAIPSLVNPTNPSLPAQVNKLIAMDNGQVIVGGDFAVKGTAYAYLVRFNPDGSVDPTFAPTLTGDVDGAVTALYTQKTDGSTPLYVGGNFTTVTWNGATVSGSTSSRGHLVRFTPAGALDTTWVPDCDAQVDAIGIQLDSNNNPLWVIIGGAFQNVQSSNFTYLARISAVNAAVDTTYNPWPNAQVTSLVVESTGNVIIGGWFTELDPLQPDGTYPTTQTAVGYVARILTNGTQDTSFTITAANDVQDIILEDNGDIVLVGDLGEVTTSTASSLGLYIARLYPTGQPDGTFLPSFDGTTFAVAEMPNGQLVVGGIFASAHSGHSLDAVPRKALARLNADGTLDVDFNPNAYGGFGAVYVESDGSYLVGGSFQSIGNVTIRNFAHILPNGQVDTSFEPNPDGPVSAIAIDSNNMIVIGGYFQNPVPVGPPPTYTPETTPIPYLARMDKSGNLDTNFNPNPNLNVTAIIATGTGATPQYLVAGGFTIWANGPGGQNNSSITTVLTEYLARINNDGSVDQTFMPQPDGQVNAILIDSTGGYLIAGGEFSTFTPNSTGIKTVTSTTEPDLARINLTNGTIDTTWNPNSLSSITTEGPVNALALTSTGEILVGGTFSGLVPGNAVDDPVSLAPTPILQSYLALIETNGDVDTSFAPKLDGPVYGLAISPVTKKIYIGGVFQNVDDVYQPWLARLNSDGTIDKNPSAVTGFGATLNGPATVIVPVGGTADQMLVGGAFTTVTPFGSSTQVQEGHLVRFNPDGSIDSSFSVAANVSGSVNAIALADNGLLYLGGNFSNIGGAYASDLARFWNDGTADTSYGADPRGGSGVNTLIVESDGNSIYVGGSFTAIGTSDSTSSTQPNPINVANFVRTNNDGSLDPTFVPPNINGPVYAANPEPNGEMVVGGNFSQVANGATWTQPAAHNGLVMFLTSGNDQGQMDPSFNPALNAGAIVYSVVIQTNNQILIGGSFNNINGTAVSNLARLNPDGSLDTSFNPMVTGGPVTAIALEPDGSIVIGGSFTAVGGTAQANLAIVSSSGALSSSFNVAVNGPVNAVVLENPNNGAPDSILVGGAFSQVGGQARNNLARLVYPVAGGSETPENTAPTVDPLYNPNVNGTVTVVAFDPNGKTYIGGTFTMVGTIPRNGFARLTETGLAVSTITNDPTYTTFTWTLSGEVPEMNSVIFQASSDGFNWSTLGAGTQVGNTNSWVISGTNTEAIPTGGSFFIQAIGESQTTQYASESEFQQIYHFYGVPQAALESSTSATGYLNQPFYYELGVTNEVGFSVATTPLPPGLMLNAALGIIYGTPTQAGTYSVTATLTNQTDSVNVPLTIVVAATPPEGGPIAPYSRIVNLSTLGDVSLLQPMSAGFIISGGPMTVLLRAIGPALGNFALPSGEVPLTQPHATLYDPHQQVIVAAEGWDNSAAMSQLAAMVGAFPIPQNTTDTSFATVLPAGGYTLRVTSGDGNTGASLVEVYDADPNPLEQPDRLVNISTIGNVAPGQPILAGFIIDGTVPKTVIVRGVGPGLAPLGISSDLYDPLLNLYDGNNTLLATCSNWTGPLLTSGSTLPATGGTINYSTYPVVVNPGNGNTSGGDTGQLTNDMTAVGAFALSDTGTNYTDAAGNSVNGYDTAIEITLPPGSYAAQVTSVNGDSGTAMVEVYENNN